MRTKGKSEGKNPGIEAIMISSPTIKKSSSSSSSIVLVVVTQIVLVDNSVTRKPTRGALLLFMEETDFLY